jgi:rod shape-determining protein MreC
MRILLKRRSIIIASAAVLIALVTLISVNLFNSSGPVTGIVSAVSSPLRALSSTVARTFEGIYASIYSYDRLLAAHDRALARIAQLERDQRESTLLAEENERLRLMLGFRERHAGYDGVDAIVSDWSSNNWSSSFIINRGSSNSNITQGNGVVTEYGVVIGQVSRVDSTTSTVITVLDTRFSLSAIVGEGGTATLRGDYAYIHSGLLVLDYIDDDMIVMVGDSVVTSGLGGVFPPGLVVGEVTAVLRHSSGIGRYATVEPIREINTVAHVFVITGFGDAE